MHLFHRFSFFLIFIAFCITGCFQQKVEILSVPAGDMPAVINTGGTAILPSGRFLTPAGDLIRITDDPFGMALSPDGKKAVTLHDGVFTIIDLQSLTLSGFQIMIKRSSPHYPMDLILVSAFAEDSKTVYLSGGDNGAVIVYDIRVSDKARFHFT